MSMHIGQELKRYVLIPKMQIFVIREYGIVILELILFSIYMII